MITKVLQVVLMLFGTSTGFNVKTLANAFGMAKKGVSRSDGDRPVWAKRRVHAFFWGLVTAMLAAYKGIEIPEGDVNTIALASENATVAGLALYTALLGAWGKVRKEKLAMVLLCFGLAVSLASCAGLKDNVRTGCIAMEDAFNKLHLPAKIAVDAELVPKDYGEDVARTYEEARIITEGVCHIAGQEVNINVWAVP